MHPNIPMPLKNWFEHFGRQRNGAMSTERSTFAWHEIEFWSDGFTKRAVWSICRKEKIAGRNVNGKEGSILEHQE